jgi:hypothetical protein
MGREDHRVSMCSRYDGDTALFDVGRKGVGLLYTRHLSPRLAFPV